MASKPSTPKLCHSGTSTRLPPPPAFASLPFNDDPPPRPATADEPPQQPIVAVTPAEEAAGQTANAETTSVPGEDPGPEHPSMVSATLPMVTDAQSALQLLPLGGAASTAMSPLAAARPGADAVSTVAAADSASDAMSTVAAAPSTQGLVRSPELPPLQSGSGKEEHGGSSGERGGDGHDADVDAKMLTDGLYMLLFVMSTMALLLFVYEFGYRLLRDGLRSTPALDGTDAQQVGSLSGPVPMEGMNRLRNPVTLGPFGCLYNILAPQTPGPCSMLVHEGSGSGPLSPPPATFEG